jgi:hypothetical protein
MRRYHLCRQHTFGFVTRPNAAHGRKRLIDILRSGRVRSATIASGVDDAAKLRANGLSRSQPKRSNAGQNCSLLEKAEGERTPHDIGADDIRSVVQDHVQERAVDMQAAVVLDETELTDLFMKKLMAGQASADPFDCF